MNKQQSIRYSLGAATKSGPGQQADEAARAFQVASTFLSGILTIIISQALGAPLKVLDPGVYQDYMRWTKESFAILVMSITQWWSPTPIRVSGDASMKNQLYQMADGSLRCNFPHRLILMANHQLYTDWLYLWWIAYTNRMHGHLYIIMKESLRRLPIIGWSGQLYRFIFLSRKWEKDESMFRSALGGFSTPQDPMWLLVFPEGTNLSAITREKSATWSKKTGISDMKHQLLPRTKGLQLCLQELRASTNWLYDCTIAYEGVPMGSYGQDIYTLRSTFLNGKPPKSVNMHWRRFRIAQIPYHTEAVFSRWLHNRWREKDYMLEYFSRHGRFPDCNAEQISNMLASRAPQKDCKVIATEVKGEGWQEFIGIFEPITSLSDALSVMDLTEPITADILKRLMSRGRSAQSSSVVHQAEAARALAVLTKLTYSCLTSKLQPA